MIGEFFGVLLEGATHFGEDQGLGWLLSAFGGQEGQQTEQQLDELKDHVDERVDALQTQITNVCNLLNDKLDQLETNDARRAYDQAAQKFDTDVNSVDTWASQLQSIAGKLQAGTAVSDLSADDLRRLSTMRDNLPNLIREMNTLMMPSGGGAEGMIQMYAGLVADQLGYSPVKVAQYSGTHIYPAEWVNANYDMVDYYTGKLALASYVYAEVGHLAFPGPNSGDTPYKSEPGDVSTTVTAAAKYAQQWSNQLSNGNKSWVKQGIGRIPQDTVVDYRDQSSPRLWTNQPVTLATDTADRAGYCATVSRFCFVNTYDHDGHVAGVGLARPQTQPIQSSIDESEHDDLDGWRVPTSKEWGTLQNGLDNRGLTAGSSAVGVTVFNRTQTVLHYKGVDSTVSAVTPMLADTSSDGSTSYAALTSVAAADTVLTAQTLNADPANAEGAALVLVRDFTFAPVVPPANQLNANTKPAKKASPAHPRKHAGSAKGRKPARLGDFQAVTFNKQGNCTTNAYTVPTGASAVQVTAVGGAGGAGTTGSASASSGGSGGSLTTTIPAQAGSKLYIQVGGNGISGGVTGATGAAPGSVDTSGYFATPGSGGSGGGASGISTSSDCTHWVVVAGGGGGGGAGFTTPTLNGGRGGDACAPDLQTCAPAGKGTNRSTYPHSGGGPGGAPGNNTGGTGGTDAPSESGSVGPDGDAGATLNGGTGGGTPSKGSGVFGGGGGGGAGYLGGGGGGGAGRLGAGGGGGGGESFAIPGTGARTVFGHVAPGDDPAGGFVTITAMATPAVIQSTATGQVVGLYGGAQPGSGLDTADRTNTPDQQWLLNTVKPADGGGEWVQLFNPATGQCASADPDQGFVYVEACTTEPEELWLVNPSLDGTTTIISGLSGDPSRSDAAMLTSHEGHAIVHNGNGSADQKWTVNATTWAALP